MDAVETAIASPLVDVSRVPLDELLAMSATNNTVLGQALRRIRNEASAPDQAAAVAACSSGL
jgi:FXSXX-COOH protein